MARRAVTLIPGLMAGGLVAALTLGTLAAVALRAEIAGGLDAADWSAVRFTILQAALSAFVSVVAAIPVARALSRRRFPGRLFLITVLGAPFVLPAIVAILGLLAVFGRAGLLNDALNALGLEPISIYGFHGVVLAHVFFNLPLATRLLLQGWAEIPSERFRLAASLGFSPHDTFRELERPMLRAVFPGALAIVFLICLTSFAVALTLGGGPRATTVELAIYQAFQFEFDLGSAARLAGVQLALTAAAGLLALALARPTEFGAGLDRPVDRWDAGTTHLRLADAIWITIASVFLLLPMLMVALSGLTGLAELGTATLHAGARSLAVALAATALTFALALPLALAAHRWRPAELLGYLPVAASPLVIGTGLFILVFPIANPAALALPVTAMVNALMALPFALRILAPAVATVETGYGRLADSLGMTGWSRLRWLLLPRLRPALGFAGGLTAALAMGDLGVIALFARPDSATLPLHVFQLMGAYRMDAAAGAAVLLLALSLGIFLIFDWLGRRNAQA